MAVCFGVCRRIEFRCYFINTHSMVEDTKSRDHMHKVTTYAQSNHICTK